MSKSVDLTNQHFGKLTVLGKGEDYISPSGAHLFRWKCQCECGNILNLTTSQLKRGQQCPLCTSRREDLTGKVFGKLTVVSAVEDYVSPKGSRMGRWHCKCACGNEIDVLGMSLKNGDTMSCGCASNEKKQKKINPSDIIGKQFGFLTVLSCIKDDKTSDGTRFNCKCICGRERILSYGTLIHNPKVSCGCKNKKPIPREKTKFPHKDDSKAKLNNTHIRVDSQRYSSKRNVIGTRIGEVEIIDEKEPHITPNGSKQRIVVGKCSCVNVFETRLTSLQKSRRCLSCAGKARRIDVVGQKFGQLTVIARADDYVSPEGVHLSQFKCKCDCGNTCVVTLSMLRKGQQSCGCIMNTAGLLKDIPELVEKYDFEMNQAEGIDFDSLTARTSRKVWWKCKTCGNSWFATIASQNDEKQHGCPYCSGRLVIEGKTDLATRCPEILAEWDYEKNTIKPNEISYASGQKVWWKCKECGHSWKQTVSNRVGNKSGCPRCNLENVNSFCEQALLFYVKQVFQDAINGDKHIGMELDVYIPSLNVAIEYDGEAWHKSVKKESIDIRKNNLCADYGIELIRIREPKLPLIDKCTIFVREDSTSNLSLDCVIGDVIRYLSSSAKVDIDTVRDTPKILEQFATKKYNNSLAANYPELALEWHPHRNGLLTPDKVNKSSRYKVWWLGKCGHEWQMKVSDRTRPEYKSKNGKTHKPQGCPYCSGKRQYPVRCIETQKVFYDIKQALAFAGLKKGQSIYKCCQGKAKSAGGYHWEYAPELVQN